MADFNKFNDLLKTSDYTAVEYFSYNKYCNFVKVIHMTSGKVFFLNISRTYKMSINEDSMNHYRITKEELQNKEFNSKQLIEYYPNIQLETKETDVFDNMSDKLKVNYKQPINIFTETAFDHIEQLKRLKYCFKTLEYKCMLQTDQYLVILNQENRIDVYKIENYPRTEIRTFYVVVSLEQLYSKINLIHNLIGQIETEFYTILNLNQEKHNHFLNTNYVEHFIKNNDQLINTKKQLQKTQHEIAKLLETLQYKESNCLQKLDTILSKPSHNVFQDASLSKQKDEIEIALKKIKTTKLGILDRMIQLDNKIKNMYLVIDQLGFNLSLSLNELRNELYKMLN